MLRCNGKDSATFLNGLCTNDILKLQDGELCEAFFLNVKAHVLAFAWVIRANDDYLVLISSPGAKDLFEHLDKYILSSMVTIELIETYAFMLCDANDLPALKGVSGFPLPSLSSRSKEEEGMKLFLGEANSIEEQVQGLLSLGYMELTQEAFSQYRIEQGFPFDRLDVDDRNLPQEVDRDDQAISFTKGCYLGQEPVARIDAMGQVRWLLRGLRFESHAVEPGDKLTLGEKTTGRVTTRVAMDQGAIALGYVRNEHSEEGTQLEHASGKVYVCTLPFSYD